MARGGRSSRALALDAARAGLGAALRRRVGLRVVNSLHRRLSAAKKRRMFYHFGDRAYAVQGDWVVEFAGRTITLPLRHDFAWSWCAALAFHGYDTELHDLYERLVTSDRGPRVFFDVGASYGLHSLRLLVHGVRVISFEPNPDCHLWFRQCAEQNGVEPEIHALAVADKAGTAELAVPGDATYLGTIVREVRESWAGQHVVRVLTVPQIALDDFVAEHSILPDLVKIDTEGSERLILSGARRVLELARPLVLFESWPRSPDRDTIFALLESVGYRIEPLAWPLRRAAPLSVAGFRDAPGMNFLARPLRV